MKVKKNIALVLVALLMLLVSGADKAYALPIGPDKYYIEAAPGEILDQELFLYGKNDLDSPQKLYISTVGMKKIGEEHEREIYHPAAENENEPANWIDLKIKETTVNPGETITIPWSITPKDVGCGTNYAGILISNKPANEEKEGTQLDLQKEIISQVHINIPGKENEECFEGLNTEDFYVNKKIKIFNYDDIPFVTRIQNEGNILANGPKGFIEIHGLGDKITIPFNPDTLDIYPETTRKFENMWIDADYPHSGSFFEKLGFELTHLRFGRYEARLGISKNVESPIIASDHFWIIPWRIIVLILLLILTGYTISKVTSKTKNKPEDTISEKKETKETNKKKKSSKKKSKK